MLNIASCLVELCGCLCDLELPMLVCAERLAGNEALVCTLYAQLKGVLCHAESAPRAHETLFFEVLHEVVEASVLLAEQVLFGNDDIVEDVLGGVLRVKADLVEQLALEARCVGGDDEQADALVGLLCVGVGDDCNDGVVGDHAVGDVDLAAVDDVVALAVLNCAGLDVSKVGAVLCLGHADADAGVAGCNAGEVLFLLCLGAVCIDVGSDGVAAQAGQNAVKAALAELFAVDDGVEHIEPSAAVLLVQPQAAVACVAELFEGLLADGVVLLHVHVIGNYLSVKKFAKLLAECFVLLGEGQEGLFR